VLDSDLATAYGVSTAAFNQAIKRNRARFPEDFAFRLTKQEHEALISQIVTSKGRGGRRKLPWVFTEHGAIMAATSASLFRYRNQNLNDWNAVSILHSDFLRGVKYTRARRLSEVEFKRFRDGKWPGRSVGLGFEPRSFGLIIEVSRQRFGVMTWQAKILDWRALTPAEKNLRRWKDIPRQVYQSMLFEQEPVSMEELLKAHDRNGPPAISILK
jgi:hypothetical protein